jgi:uncharacterized membrane protein
MNTVILISDFNYSILAIISGFLAAIFAFVISWKFSNLFIPPRYNWSKSPYTVFMIKLSIASTAAFYAFIGVMGLIVAIR